jgi:hypothetical protein
VRPEHHVLQGAGHVQLDAGLLSSDLPEASANGKSDAALVASATTPALRSDTPTLSVSQTSTVLRHGERVGPQQGFNGGWKLKSVQQTVATVQNCITGTMQDTDCVE